MSIVAAYVVPHPPLIVPAVGRGEEKAIQKTIDAYREVARRIAAHAPETIVVTSPHAPLFRDCFHVSAGNAGYGDMGRFGAREASLTVSYDDVLAADIADLASERGIPLSGNRMHDDELDHATFVPLWFVNEALSDYRVVRIGLSGLSNQAHRSLGLCIAEAACDLDRRCVLVASGDLSHKLKADGPYGYAPEGPAFDRQVTALLGAGDLRGLFSLDEELADAAAECGLRSFWIMAGVLAGVSFEHELLSYEGPFGVGYALAAFEVDDAEEPASLGDGEDAVDPYVELARAGVEGFVRSGCPILRPADLPSELTEKRAGVFVSLHEHGDLRGCIGTIEATTDSVADEIIRNGAAAAGEDPHFPPVRPDELDFLSYSVDVLFPPEPVASVDGLDPVRYGVIVTKGWRRGLLLPNLEGVDSVADQIAIAKRKAGIDPADDDVELERFEVVRHDRGGEPRRG